MTDSVQIIASSSSWIEQTAVDQLHRTAELEGIEWAVGLPDLHAGRGIPIGTAFWSRTHAYPHLIDNDIGCGMALWQPEKADQALHSLAHGAGRKWPRSSAKAKLGRKISVAELERTSLGGRVLCEDNQLIFEEAPQVYKGIESVISDLEQADLISVIAVLRPVITYKTTRK